METEKVRANVNGEVDALSQAFFNDMQTSVVEYYRACLKRNNGSTFTEELVDGILVRTVNIFAEKSTEYLTSLKKIIASGTVKIEAPAVSSISTEPSSVVNTQVIPSSLPNFAAPVGGA